LINIHYAVTSSAAFRVTQASVDDVPVQLHENEVTLVVDELVASPLGSPLKNDEKESAPSREVEEQQVASAAGINQENTILKDPEVEYSCFEEVSEEEDPKSPSDYLLTGTLANVKLEDDHGVCVRADWNVKLQMLIFSFLVPTLSPIANQTSW
jgi:hypothetical protein